MRARFAPNSAYNAVMELLFHKVPFSFWSFFVGPPSLRKSLAMVADINSEREAPIRVAYLSFGAYGYEITAPPSAPIGDSEFGNAPA